MSDETTLIQRGPFEWTPETETEWATVWPTSERDNPMRALLLGLNADIEQVCALLNRLHRANPEHTP